MSVPKHLKTRYSACHKQGIYGENGFPTPRFIPAGAGSTKKPLDDERHLGCDCEANRFTPLAGVGRRRLFRG